MAYNGVCRTSRGLVWAVGWAALVVLERIVYTMNNQLRTGADKGNPTV